MLAAIPDAAKYPHQAFALRPEDASEARAIAMLHVAHDDAWRERLARFVARPRELRPDLRRTPLDPRLAPMIARLRSHPGAYADGIERATAGFDDTPREVLAASEGHAMRRAMRTRRLLDVRAPPIIVENELARLARALDTLDAPTAAPDEDDEPETLDVPDAIVHRAIHDLSLGAHAETLRWLQELAPDVALDVDALVGEETLVPFPALKDAHEASTEEGARMLLARLRFWKAGPSLETMSEVATELADALAGIDAETRAAVTAELEQDRDAELAGGDYVASAEARLRAIAAEAHEAARAGLVVLSEVSRNVAY